MSLHTLLSIRNQAFQSLTSSGNTAVYDDAPAQGKDSTREVEKYEDLSRHELLSQVRQELEKHLEKEFARIEESLRARASDIVRDVSQRLFETWREPTAKTASSAETTCLPDSSRGTTVCEHNPDITQNTKEETLSSTFSSICNVQEAAGRFHSSAMATPEQLGNDFDFDKFLGTGIFDGDLGKFFEGGPNSNLGVESETCDLGYGNYPVLLDPGVSPCDIPGKTTGGSSTGDDSSLQRVP